MPKLRWLTGVIRRITLNITAPTDADSDLLSLEIPPDTTVSTLKQSVQAESRIPVTSQHLYHNGLLLNDDTKTMEQLQIGDGEMLALHVRDMVGSTGAAPAGQRRAQPARQQRRPGEDMDPELIRLQLLGNPQWRQQIVSQKPELGAVIEDPERFAQVYLRMQEQEREEHMRRQQAIVELNSDPFDADAQRRIEEMIREERVQENLQNAIEHNPEGTLV
jgi:DNA damage-inducible protein 1